MEHRRFQDMCALAITGQLGGSQMCELDQHIAVCESCRKSLETTARFSVQAMPILSQMYAPTASSAPPEGMRERFLERLRLETIRPTGDIPSRPFRASTPTTLERIPKRITATSGSDRYPVAGITANSVEHVFSWRSVAFATGCVAVVLGAYYAGAHRSVHSPSSLTAVPPSISKTSAPEPNPAPAQSSRINDLERQKLELETKLAGMRQDLTAAQRDREALGVELAQTRAKLAISSAQTPIQSPSTPVVTMVDDASSNLQAEISRLGGRLAESEVRYNVQKQLNDELTAKFETATSELQRERDTISARTELSDVVAARNLHIVDVYDADPSGKRQRPFGRVFYIEGKSLVFYAYDLNDPGQFKTNVVFHVWGGKAGVKEVTHSLGILRKDDTGQNRWAMTFDDPNVLGQINSVFVTSEAANKHDGEPHGKKVLYAYFGSQPNHP